MEHVGIEISSIRPNDGADLWIDYDSSEEVVVSSNVVEHRTPEKGRQVYNAIGTIREAKANDSVMHDFYVGYIDHAYSCGNGSIVRVAHD
jgi:hypothetical protein